MDDLDTLFSKFHSNRLKHGKIYNVTIQKYDKLNDDTEELDFDKEFPNEDEDEIFEEAFESSDDENDQENHEVQKKCISKYFSALKEQMTSTPIYPDKVSPKKTIFQGISPLVPFKNQKKKDNKYENLTSTPLIENVPGSEINNQKLNGITPVVACKRLGNRSQFSILNTILERNHLNKISSIKANDKNDSVILCKPRDKENLKPIQEIDEKPFPHKLDFDFDVSDDDDDQEAEKKKVPPKLSQLLQSSQNILHLSIPSPNDKMKQFCHKFNVHQQDNHNNSLIRKMHPDLNMSPVSSSNDKLKMMCEQFSRQNSSPTKAQKFFNKGDKSIRNAYISKENEKGSAKKEGKYGDDDNSSENDDDTLGELNENYVNKLAKIRPFQSTPLSNLSNKKTHEILDLSKLPLATPNEKMKLLASDLVNKEDNRINESNNKTRNTKNDLLKKMCNSFVFKENKTNDLTKIKVSENFEKNFSKAKPDEREKNSEANKELLTDDDDEDQTLDKLFEKFVKNNKNQIVSSTPAITQPNKKDTLSNEVSKNHLAKSNDTIKNNQDKNQNIEITISESSDSSSNKNNKKNYDFFNQIKYKKKSKNSEDNNDVILIEWKDKPDLGAKSNSVEKQNDKDKPIDDGFKKPQSIKVIEKRAEKRIYINQSNISIDSNRPDFKKICLEKFHQNISRTTSIQSDTSQRKLYINTSNIVLDSERPDFRKICRDKFHNKTEQSDNEKKILITQKSSLLSQTRSDPMKNMLKKTSIMSNFKT